MLSGPSLRRLKRRRWRLLFALLPLFALLGLAEIAARLSWRPPSTGGAPGGELVPHPTRIWALGAGRVHAYGVEHAITPDGLRQVELKGAPRRLLTLGDSSVFGHGLAEPETLHAQLAAALSARGVEADVLCGGVPGYSTEQSLRLLSEVGWDQDPDLLVIGNLWSDNNADHFVDRELLDELARPTRRIDAALRRWSVAWRSLRQRASLSDERGFLPVGWVQGPAPPPDGRRRVPLSDYAANLDRMLIQAAERQVGAVFLAPCNRLRLEPETPHSLWDPYFEAMLSVAERRGVPVVDGRSVLEAADLTAAEAFLDVMHPTGPANAAYADALTDVLFHRGWPGEPLLPDPAPPPFSETLQDPFTDR